MTHDLLRRLLIVLLSTAALGACSASSSFVEDDDPDTEVPSSGLVRGMMEGLGAVPARQTAINYQPRGPLVMPSNASTLPPPEDRNQVAATGNWPVDPDEQQRQVLRNAAARDARRGDNPVVSSSELLDVRVPRTQEQEILSRRQKELARDPSRRLSTRELNAADLRQTDATLYDSEGRPVRRALTQPPSEYMTPSDAYPVAIPEEAPNEGLMGWLWK
ncbi:hypothetical protein [Methylobrevis albus]|uniref:Beta-barrel assembly machine subunit BamF n=1 Tax=Methylobrevis albus TaxID=2793297 RepID=A0A931I3F5_9HYPH|nr:hypothetical protein [Methylobrevis albus]MBH0238191.1 hypothetical protein [Methylobrevis albus]